MVHQIKSYLSHWLNSVGTHSLQAPFVYNLYTQVILADNDSQVFQSYRDLQKTFYRSDQLVEAVQLGADSKVEAGITHAVSKIARHGTSQAKISRLLYRLAQSNNSKTIVELGTSLGINTCYLSAIEDAEVFTFEGAPQIAAIAKTNFSEQNRTNISLITGEIDSTLDNFLDGISQIDFAFIDANHRYEPTLRYFEMLKSKAQPETIIVLDDIYWSREMTRAWKHIISSDAITLSLDLFNIGVVFIRPELTKQNLQLRF